MKPLSFGLILLLLIFNSCETSDNAISPRSSESSRISRDRPVVFKVVSLPENFVDPISAVNLNEIRTNLIGTWFGTVETPWTDPYHLVFKFNESNVYSGYNITNNGYAAFYYGTDADSSAKTMIFKDILADGSVEGEIKILHASGSTEIDDINDLRYYNSYQNLRFNIWHNKIYGPIQFSLFKISE